MSIETSARSPNASRPGKPKIENVQALRGIAIVMVLLYHIGKYEHRIFAEHALLPAITYAGRAGVDLFFVISGFVMLTITHGRFGQAGGAKMFFLRRAARIYPLYWFFTLVYLPFYLFQPALMTRVEGVEAINLPSSFLLLPSQGVPLVGQGWTLIHEMYFYVVFALVLLRPERERSKLLLAWGIILLGSFWWLKPGTLQHSPTLALVTNPMTLEFLAGCGIAWLVVRGLNRHSMPALLLGAIGFALTPCLPPDWNRVARYLIPVGLLVYGAVAAEARTHVLFPRWLRFVGDISYSLYLSHTLVLSLVKKLFVMSGFRSGLVSDLLFIGLSAAACIGAAALCYRWIEQPLLAFSYATAAKLASLRLWGHRSA